VERRMKRAVALEKAAIAKWRGRAVRTGRIKACGLLTHEALSPSRA